MVRARVIVIAILAVTTIEATTEAPGVEVIEVIDLIDQMEIKQIKGTQTSLSLVLSELRGKIETSVTALMAPAATYREDDPGLQKIEIEIEIEIEGGTGIGIGTEGVTVIIVDRVLTREIVAEAGSVAVVGPEIFIVEAEEEDVMSIALPIETIEGTEAIEAMKLETAVVSTETGIGIEVEIEIEGVIEEETEKVEKRERGRDAAIAVAVAAAVSLVQKRLMVLGGLDSHVTLIS